jgi:hypothetical protein
MDFLKALSKNGSWPTKICFCLATKTKQPKNGDQTWFLTIWRRCPKSYGYPQSSSMLFSDFPWTKASSDKGGTHIYGNPGTPPFKNQHVSLRPWLSWFWRFRCRASCFCRHARCTSSGDILWVTFWSFNNNHGNSIFKLISLISVSWFHR